MALPVFIVETSLLIAQPATNLSASVVLMVSWLMVLAHHVHLATTQETVSVLFAHYLVQSVKVQHSVHNVQINTILKLITVLILVLIIRFRMGLFVTFV